MVPSVGLLEAAHGLLSLCCGFFDQKLTLLSIFIFLSKQEWSISPLKLARRVDGREDERDSEQLEALASDQHFDSFFLGKIRSAPVSRGPVPCCVLLGSE